MMMNCRGTKGSGLGGIEGAIFLERPRKTTAQDIFTFYQQSISGAKFAEYEARMITTRPVHTGHVCVSVCRVFRRDWAIQMTRSHCWNILLKCKSCSLLVHNDLGSYYRLTIE